MAYSRPQKRSGDWAEMLAIQALELLASDPERLGRFLAESGIGPESLRAAARDPTFLVGVLDHVMSDETLVAAVAEACKVRPDEVAKARQMIGGLEWERDTP